MEHPAESACPSRRMPSSARPPRPAALSSSRMFCPVERPTAVTRARSRRGYMLAARRTRREPRSVEAVRRSLVRQMVQVEGWRRAHVQEAPQRREVLLQAALRLCPQQAALSQGRADCAAPQRHAHDRQRRGTSWHRWRQRCGSVGTSRIGRPPPGLSTGSRSRGATRPRRLRGLRTICKPAASAPHPCQGAGRPTPRPLPSEGGGAGLHLRARNSQSEQASR